VTVFRFGQKNLEIIENVIRVHHELSRLLNKPVFEPIALGAIDMSGDG